MQGSRLQNAFSHAFKCCVDEPCSHLESVTDTANTPRRGARDGQTRLFRSNVSVAHEGGEIEKQSGLTSDDFN